MVRWILLLAPWVRYRVRDSAGSCEADWEPFVDAKFLQVQRRLGRLERGEWACGPPVAADRPRQWKCVGGNERVLCIQYTQSVLRNYTHTISDVLFVLYLPPISLLLVFVSCGIHPTIIYGILSAFEKISILIKKLPVILIYFNLHNYKKNQ